MKIFGFLLRMLETAFPRTKISKFSMHPDPLILPPQAVAFTNTFSINSRLDTRQHIHGNVVPISDGNFFIRKNMRPQTTRSD